jgi:DNA-3-methyladenine glycosylase I
MPPENSPSGARGSTAFQAGLSWSIILRKRDAFRKAFKSFRPEKVARFGAADVARLMNDAGIVRSRAKIEATIGGARVYLAMQDAGVDFSGFVWGMAGGKAGSAPACFRRTAVRVIAE